MEGIIKGLTLHQPWASAIALGLKRYETRSWRTSYRGPLAIHASLAGMDLDANLLAARYGLRGAPRGAIVAVVELFECFPIVGIPMSQTEVDFGVFRPGRYAWELTNIRPLREPYPILGHQGLWNVPDDAAARLLEAAG
jgi:hypothetical protein